MGEGVWAERGAKYPRCEIRTTAAYIPACFYLTKQRSGPTLFPVIMKADRRAEDPAEDLLQLKKLQHRWLNRNKHSDTPVFSYELLSELIQRMEQEKQAESTLHKQLDMHP